MIDPPRGEAIEAVALCQQAGIQVKMITGDHALTAATIAGQLGIEGKEDKGKLKAYTGLELQGFSDDELKQIANEVSVFARVSPDQKTPFGQSSAVQRIRGGNDRRRCQ